MLEFQFVKRSDANIAKGKYIEALKQLEAHGFVNNYIATGLTIPWNLINTPDSRPLIEDTIDNCMRMAKKYGNNHLYSTACHWKGIIASHYGERDVAMKWYNDCNKIRTEIGEIGPLMNIRNGLSYESLCRALYKDAYDLVNGVISNIYNLNDYSRIVDCLKNISYALFYARHYDIAHEIFSLLLHFLRLFNMEEQAYNSFLPSRSDILILKTIIDLDRKCTSISQKSMI
jgi:tetratricopeptide (TPR) repeat protein